MPVNTTGQILDDPFSGHCLASFKSVSLIRSRQKWCVDVTRQIGELSETINPLIILPE